MYILYNRRRKGERRGRDRLSAVSTGPWCTPTVQWHLRHPFLGSSRRELEEFKFTFGCFGRSYVYTVLYDGGRRGGRGRGTRRLVVLPVYGAPTRCHCISLCGGRGQF